MVRFDLAAAATLILGMSCILPGPLQAAEFAARGDADMGCHLTLSGKILAGDAERFRDFMQSTEVRPRPGETLMMCLDSPGGNYAEGIKIADYVSDSDMGTAIGPDRRCESACALIFMAGRIHAGDGYTEPKRVLHPKGRLGFHAPGLTVANGDYTEEAVNSAYDVAILSIREFIRFREQRRLDFPEVLLLEMLGTPPSQMRLVETIEDAALWNIEINPVGNPPGGPEQILWDACNNLQKYTTGSRTGPPGPPPANLIGSVESTSSGATLQTDIGFLAEGQGRCRLIFGGTAWVDPKALGLLSFVDGGMARSGTRLHRNLLFPSDTRLTALPPPNAGDNERLLAKLVSGAGGGGGTCAIAKPTARVINVQDFVNMRQFPDFGSPVVRQLPLGAVVQVFGDPILTDLGGMRTVCTDACGGLRGQDAALVRQCIDSNTLWHNVMDDRGMRGFVSRRFLE